VTDESPYDSALLSAYDSFGSAYDRRKSQT